MINGIINIYKEAGFTSHDVVAKLRGIVKQKKIGHTGTLDPDAVGVLPVCFGNATRLCDMLTDKTKEYRARMLLGKTSDTQDASGTILTEKEVTASKEEVREAVMSFVGTYDQIPPMYSALKVNGKKLYELARQGVEIERKPRTVEIHHIRIEEIALPYVTFTVGCSKGTYIRALCADIGDKLGCGALMESLVRTRVGTFPIEEALKLSQVEELVREGHLEERVIAPDAVFEEYEAITALPEADKALLNGNKLYFGQVRAVRKRFADGEWVRVYASNGTFTGVYVFSEEEHGFKPYKMFL
ncbi:MAG: tRNA pseudouridine(55) synthase TruB [Roseburia sp.]|nr:tRNA pseudouridine(55) synthase TruB [Roseburia sp.]